MINKIKGKIYSNLAMLNISYRWPTYWWRRCGYSIGKNSVISQGVLIWAWHHLDSKNVIIEDDVSIGPRVIIIVRSHSIKQIEIEGKTMGSIPGKVIIKRGAWIGAGSIILPNITIGECGVVGAGAVVTKDVPPYTIVAGVPAKAIKKIMRKI